MPLAKEGFQSSLLVEYVEASSEDSAEPGATEQPGCDIQGTDQHSLKAEDTVQVEVYRLNHILPNQKHKSLSVYNNMRVRLRI